MDLPDPIIDLLQTHPFSREQVREVDLPTMGIDNTAVAHHLDLDMARVEQLRQVSPAMQN